MTRVQYINIDSRDRNRNVWPSSNRFEVKFDPSPDFVGASVQRSFKNIISVELIHAIFPNTNDVLNQGYLNLHIPEIDGPPIETTNSGSRVFAKLIPSQVIGPFVQSYQDVVEKPSKFFPFQGVRLDRMTVEFRDSRGELFNFGADNAVSSEPNPLLQTSLLLKIVTDDKITI